MPAAAKRETSRAVTRRVGLVTGLLLILFTLALASALVQLHGAQQGARDAVAGHARAADAASLRAEREHQGAVLSEYLVDHDDADIAEYRQAQRRSHVLEARLA